MAMAPDPHAIYVCKVQEYQKKFVSHFSAHMKVIPLLKVNNPPFSGILWFQFSEITQLKKGSNVPQSQMVLKVNKTQFKKKVEIKIVLHSEN